MSTTEDLTTNSTYPITYTSNSIIVTIASICIIIGTYSSILHVLRYFRQFDPGSFFLALIIHIYCNTLI
jgi:hypothetical protein